MFCKALTFFGRGWIPCQVNQYPKYSISNSAKCDLLALTLNECGFALFGCLKVSSFHNPTCGGIIFHVQFTDKFF